MSSLYQTRPAPTIKNVKYINCEFRSPIKDNNIERIDARKLANMNALDACLPSDMAPKNATIHTTPSIAAMKLPPTPMLRNLKRLYRLSVSPVPNSG